MKNGFYTIMAAQFFSSLADNALLIAAIALLHEIAAPAWMTPLLKLFFVFFFVALAACFGAAAYSPAKYGILTELLPPEKLVIANGWIEGTTVGSIILGTALGGWLI